MPAADVGSFDGRTVLVTGAGHGLGRAFALHLGAAGANVVVNDIGRDEAGTPTAQGVVDEIVAAGGNAVANLDSIGESGGAARAVAMAVDAFGRIDALVNNAGIVRDSTFADQPFDDLDAILAVHVRGAFEASQAAFRHMASQGYGRIVSMSSSSGVFGLPTHSAYGTAKTALIGMTNVMALEGAKFGIKANAVLPYATTNPGRTAAAAGLGAILGDAAARMTTDFVAPLVMYLASEGCDSNGSVYSSLAGRYARIATVVSEGWFSSTPPSMQDVAENFAAITEVGEWCEPVSLEDEVRLAVARANRIDA
jgi:NAD(P)-dependent dehydrogenase (short-subunit alcohol dehydrogenase family)